MPVRQHTSPVLDGVPLVEVRNPAGSLTVESVAGATELQTTVEPLNPPAAELLGRVTLEYTDTSGPRLLVGVPERGLLATARFAVTVRTPEGTAVQAHTASADVVLRGRLGSVTVSSASGDVAVEGCTGLEVKGASGGVRAGRVDGDVRVATASGDVRVDDAGGSVDLRTASGDLVVGHAGGDVTAVTASGDVSVARATAGTVQLRTVSGDATIGVAPGLRLWLDLQSITGRLDSQLDTDTGSPDGDPATLSLELRSVSGDLRLRRST
ncbi:DUF4097 domain-containing protein [Geodermatophilaceae bacterium NBWT11]|nr:DUF4097 domain-containing protein [Geodermatophilaceae bacterium NBWT11]